METRWKDIDDWESLAALQIVHFVKAKESFAADQQDDQPTSAQIYREIISDSSIIESKRSKRVDDNQQERLLISSPERPLYEFKCDICQFCSLNENEAECHQARLTHYSGIEHQLNKNKEIDKQSTKADIALRKYSVQHSDDKGYQLLRKEGWAHGSGLGSQSHGRRTAISIPIKYNRKGIESISKRMKSKFQAKESDFMEKTLTPKESAKKVIRDEHERKVTLENLKSKFDFTSY